MTAERGRENCGECQDKTLGEALSLQILFLLVAQVLTNKLLNNSQIKRMNLDGVDIRLSLFADDTDLFLEPSVECIGAVISELNNFGLYSGCKPTLNETKCIPRGYTRNDAMFLRQR